MLVTNGHRTESIFVIVGLVNICSVLFGPNFCERWDICKWMWKLHLMIQTPIGNTMFIKISCLVWPLLSWKLSISLRFFTLFLQENRFLYMFSRIYLVNQQKDSMISKNNEVSTWYKCSRKSEFCDYLTKFHDCRGQTNNGQWTKTTSLLALRSLNEIFTFTWKWKYLPFPKSPKRTAESNETHFS